MKRTVKYANLSKEVISMKVIIDDHEYLVINRKRILRYYTKKVFHYFFESKEEFYAHMPYITAIFAGVMLNVIARVCL